LEWEGHQPDAHRFRLDQIQRPAHVDDPSAPRDAADANAAGDARPMTTSSATR
jgi:hypothetical protein